MLPCPSAGGSNPASAVLHAEASCLQGKPAYWALHPFMYLTFTCYARGGQDNFQSTRTASRYVKSRHLTATVMNPQELLLEQLTCFPVSTERKGAMACSVFMVHIFAA